MGMRLLTPCPATQTSNIKFGVLRRTPLEKFTEAYLANFAMMAPLNKQPKMAKNQMLS